MIHRLRAFGPGKQIGLSSSKYKDPERIAAVWQSVAALQFDSLRDSIGDTGSGWFSDLTTTANDVPSQEHSAVSLIEHVCLHSPYGLAAQHRPTRNCIYALGSGATTPPPPQWYPPPPPPPPHGPHPRHSPNPVLLRGPAPAADWGTAESVRQ